MSEITRDTLLQTPMALPLADHVIGHAPSGGLVFQPFHLQQLLQFLESVVWYERVIVPTCEIDSPFSEKISGGDVFARFAPGAMIVRYAPAGDYWEPLLRELAASGVVSGEVLSLVDVDPRDLFRKQVDSSHVLLRDVREIESAIQSEERDPELRSETAFLIAWAQVGRPLYLAEVARRAGAQCRFFHAESAWVSRVESAERKVLRGLVSQFAGSLNAGVAAEISRIESLGGRTSFPPTPIAWQILSSASSPQNLASVTLQVRDRYKHVRKYIRQLESELKSDEITLKRKLQIADEIGDALRNLAPGERTGFPRILMETASFVGSLPMAAPESISAGAKVIGDITGWLTKLPTMMRRRRYRVLFASKKRFLNARGSISVISKLFNVPETAVREGFGREAKLTGDKA